ncbi:hypothetical protein [Natronobacterium gregoryi]|uniref:Uncharacterized protein n=2 Tax=Natronobacterium gregoryi TaxID=44930 RepID=L0AKZ2_NATGS|nr:hypothetical protein [Natronobacterium gregoryi]AFZ74568.1 hypothetical protein Natgr_3449 [Natronobacterium gregoryi SP2]ELY72363.1 hypothetical protein C490_03428 [Natronobacterium gregoryi SP2]PLK21691.1 hypothetical protein CYV19_02320 [Natronobacterium gregoryi SP2]SFI96004.1 hypothetical protein SAMN05443661_110137 [Natronobacterium gregoryi]
MGRSVADPIEELARWTILYIVSLLTVPIAAVWVWFQLDGHWIMFVLLAALIVIILFATSRAVNSSDVAASE